MLHEPSMVETRSARFASGSFRVFEMSFRVIWESALSSARVQSATSTPNSPVADLPATTELSRSLARAAADHMMPGQRASAAVITV